MVSKVRWVIWSVPILFLALIFAIAWHQDHDFWRSTRSLYGAAQEAQAKGDQTRALELARKAWARDPNNAEYGIFLGRVYLDTGQVKAALEISQQVMDRNPGPGALVVHALALDQLGQPKEALDVLAWYLGQQPDDREVLATAGAIAARHEEYYPQAVTSYRQLYRLDRDPGVRRVLAKLLASLDRYKDAIQFQEEEVAEFPEDREALHFLALLHYWQRDYRVASDIYQRLLETGAKNSKLRLEAARAADAAHEDDRALDQYLWLYARHRGEKEYALALARLWAQKGNHAEAAGVLAPLMHQQPDFELRRWYGLELLLIGDFDKAQREYHKAWEEGDTHQETIINLARLYARKNRFGPAAAMWDEALRRRLVKGEMRWEAALTYSYAKRYQDALEIIAPFRQQHPNDPKVLLFSGQLHFYQKHWSQAVHFFSAYLEQNPQDAEVRRQLAEAYSFQPEARKEALEQYGEALKLKDDVNLRLRRISLLLEDQRWDQAARELRDCPTPDDPQLLRQEAHLHLWLGDLPEALKYYDLFLKKAPGDRVGRLEKARVLTYLGRGPEALELLNRLRMDQPKDPLVRVVAIEAYLTSRDFPKALALAQKELEPLPDLSLEERALVARCYAHSTETSSLYRAVDLLMTNLWKNRYHHASLLILASLLPRLPRYEDLNRVMYRLPGVRVGGPEQVSALSYFAGQAGRQGGKLNYLLHVLQEYRRHRQPKSPGELLALAWLAVELDNQPAALRYYQRAQRLRPQDQSIAKLLMQCQMGQKNFGQTLKLLEADSKNPGAPLEMARIYLMRRQYEGVRAAVAKIPADSPDYSQGMLLLVRACRAEQSYPEALQTLAPLEGKIPPEDFLMEKARTLEAMGDKEAVTLYRQVSEQKPGSQAARVAKAREARTQGNWGAAYKEYAVALKEAPQDIELLNELEDIRQQMRPQMASRGFPGSRGERRPEEAQRPWQFSSFNREPRGLGLSNYLPAFISDVLPIVQPESLYLTDSNKLHGVIFRIAGGFWITRVLPAQLGLEYREYNQNNQNVKYGQLNMGLSPVFAQGTDASSRLRRAEISLGLGPLAVDDRLKLSGELIARRYWKRSDFHSLQMGQVQIFTPGFTTPFFLTGTIFPQTATTNRTTMADFTRTDSQNRLLGSLELGFSPWAKTDATLRYSRRDIFDQDAYLFPRLYQSVLNLTEASVTTYHQVDLSYNHQFRPGLNWRGNAGGAFYSDQNRRLTLYQGLTWQAVGQPRMHLEFTPHYFLASYAQRHDAYFSPGAYNAIGLGVDFDRQIFRLPTLILQATAQAVGQHGDWGPSLQGLAALEWEFVHNFYMDVHAFYFREWVDNYRLFTAGASFRWRF
ncbi:MAG: tetratricopeptide repeat protein [Syntrophobacterales bacterium]|jgi:tetratricopeptide (TPR) repeat protein|nr:tetratricopeptide repeat protein [Syntrophobacterales bacterium]